jgi:osmotically-inducible protein OsmY
MEDTMMKTDSDIRRDVEAELQWTPDVDETDISVKVHGGVATLTGFVHTYFEKDRAERAVKRIAGVAGVANDIQIRPSAGDEMDDPEIARAAVSEIRSELPLSAEGVKVLVDHGHVTLEGNVPWDFQRERIESAVRRLRGVTAVNDQITIRPRVKPQEVKRLIEDAFRRSAEVDAKGISVEADGGEVRLRGKVRTWSEREQAQHTAWSAPGVTNVKNELAIST